LRKTPSETTNLGDANPDKVATLQKRANELAAAQAKPLMLTTEFAAMKKRLSLPPLPDEDMLSGAEEAG
jgi:hypothetical protein